MKSEREQRRHRISSGWYMLSVIGSVGIIAGAAYLTYQIDHARRVRAAENERAEHVMAAATEAAGHLDLGPGASDDLIHRILRIWAFEEGEGEDIHDYATGSCTGLVRSVQAENNDSSSPLVKTEVVTAHHCVEGDVKMMTVVTDSDQMTAGQIVDIAPLGPVIDDDSAVVVTIISNEKAWEVLWPYAESVITLASGTTIAPDEQVTVCGYPAAIQTSFTSTVMYCTTSQAVLSGNGYVQVVAEFPGGMSGGPAINGQGEPIAVISGSNPTKADEVGYLLPINEQ